MRKRPLPSNHGEKLSMPAPHRQSRRAPAALPTEAMREEKGPKAATGGTAHPPAQSPRPQSRTANRDNAASPRNACGEQACVFPAQWQPQVIVVGAGAAGLFCSRLLSRQGLRVLLLEKAALPGRKLAVSGGGKANFSNKHIGEEHYFCHAGTAFCKPALKAFSPQAMLKLVSHWALPVEERDHGQLFLKVGAQKIVQALVQDCLNTGRCQMLCQTEVTHISRSAQGFSVETTSGIWQARSLVLACGSPAWPQAGGSAQGYALAQAEGHKLIAPRAVLAPLRLDASEELHASLLELTGISLPVRISLPQAECTGEAPRCWKDDLLFTHDSLSGPASLKASLFWREGQSVLIDFLPEDDLKSMLDQPEVSRQTPRSLLSRHLPQRLVDALLPPDTARRKLAELSRAARTAILERVKQCRLRPCGTAGLKKAEACAGGIDTADVDSQTMQSKLCQDLYILGEMLDVTGLLGGYNLHWAWASATVAARHISANRHREDTEALPRP